jgi:hypothetical protein
MKRFPLWMDITRRMWFTRLLRTRVDASGPASVPAGRLPPSPDPPPADLPYSACRPNKVFSLKYPSHGHF